MQIEPIYDRLIIKRDEPKTKTDSGLYIPGDAVDKPITGVIVACGEGVLGENDQIFPLEVKVGDRVLFPKHCGVDIELEGENYLIVVEEEVFGVVEEGVVEAEEI